MKYFIYKEPMIKNVSPKNKDKNNGINISANGINPTKASSCVKDIEIQ